jgi:hypothetical protein
VRNPCKKDCPGRSATCHAECDAYLEFHNWNRKQYAERLKQQPAESYMNDQIEASKKIDRRYGSKKR